MMIILPDTYITIPTMMSALLHSDTAPLAKSKSLYEKNTSLYRLVIIIITWVLSH